MTDYIEKVSQKRQLAKDDQAIKVQLEILATLKEILQVLKDS